MYLIILKNLLPIDYSYTTRDKPFFIDLLKAISIVAVVSFHDVFNSASYKHFSTIIDIVFSLFAFVFQFFLRFLFYYMKKANSNNLVSQLGRF